jgi:hypothetical protein
LSSGQHSPRSENAPNGLHADHCLRLDIRVNGITVQNSQREHLLQLQGQLSSPEHSPGTVGVLHVYSVNVHTMGI